MGEYNIFVVEKIKVVDVVAIIFTFFFFQVHNDYCMAFDYHAQNNNPASATALTEAHNNYVQQLHAANGMIDQYYKETLPQLLQVRSHSTVKSFQNHSCC